ncbi:hypothetical protein QTI66_39115 [Variovorax sp. J22R133]|uniref:hypothetical protein n=1 Tax=Variovorax brevis TaxID=3053503 RepID=UPI002575D72A|nr:hypothetical protein [Variovorax sp. J22R133]MDM0118084.1 hypothetical protein [Variovorax sp. J22R133]
MAADSSSLMDSLSASGYTDLRMLRGKLCAVKQFNFTTAIVVGMDVVGYERRYCYEQRGEAQAALLAWDGDGHPSGPWIKCKGAGIDLLNPAFC